MSRQFQNSGQLQNNTVNSVMSIIINRVINMVINWSIGSYLKIKLTNVKKISDKQLKFGRKQIIFLT